MADERTQRLLAARLAEEQAGYRLPSLAAGLTRGGELVWSGGRGLIGGTEGPAPDADVQYRAGSITKTFIAVAVLRLRAEGLVDLSDPIGRYLDPAGGAAELTIGQLLSHTSGLRAEAAGPWWERTAGSPFASLAQASLGPDARRLRAGWQYHYSNVGYALLGELVARLRGRPWYDVVAAELVGTWYWGPTAFLVSVGGGVLEFRMAGSGARAFRFAQGSDGGWTGLDGYFAGEPLRPVRGPDGRVVALDLASHIYTRLPYDPSAPVPGGVDPGGWRG